MNKMLDNPQLMAELRDAGRIGWHRFDGPPEPPQVIERPKALHPTVDSFQGLQEWIDARLASIENDLGDDETCQHLGQRKIEALQERRATLLDVAWLIQGAVADEAAQSAAEAHTEAVEAAYKANGIMGQPETALMDRLRDGDR